MKLLIKLYINLEKKKLSSLLFLYLLISFCVYFVSHQDYPISNLSTNLESNYIAAAQKVSDTYNPFSTETFVLKENNNTKMPSTNWLFIYISGLLAALSSLPVHIVYFLINLLIGFIGFYYLYKSFKLIGPKNIYLPYFLAAIAFSLPINQYFFSASTPYFYSLQFIYIGLYHYLYFYLSKKSKSALYFFVFMAIASLASVHLFLLSLSILIMYTFNWYFKEQAFQKKILQGSIAVFLLLFVQQFGFSFIRSMNRGSLFHENFGSLPLNALAVKLNAALNIIESNQLYSSFAIMAICILLGFTFYNRFILNKPLSYFQKHVVGIFVSYNIVALVWIYFNAKNLNQLSILYFISLVNVVLILLFVSNSLNENIQKGNHRFLMLFSLLFVLGITLESTSASKDIKTFKYGSVKHLNHLNYQGADTLLHSITSNFSAVAFNNYPAIYFQHNFHPLKSTDAQILNKASDTLLFSIHDLIDLQENSPNYINQLNLVTSNAGVALVNRSKKNNTEDIFDLLKPIEYDAYHQVLYQDPFKNIYNWQHHSNHYLEEDFDATIELIKSDKVNFVIDASALEELKNGILRTYFYASYIPKNATVTFTIKVDKDYYWSESKNIEDGSNDWAFLIPPLHFNENSSCTLSFSTPSGKLEIENVHTSFYQLSE